MSNEEKLLEDNKRLIKENTELKREVEFLKQEIKRLVGELRKFMNENTPSGSIPPYLKPSVEKKARQERKSEPTENNNLNARNSRSKEFDRERKITTKNCPCCNGKRLTKKKKTYTRTTLHILMPSIERMKNIIATYYCLDCKKEVVPRLPDALPGSKFDLNTIVLISVLFTGYNLSEKNITKIFSTIFGLKISPATISNSLKRLKDYLQDDYKKLEEEIQNAKFVHRDETGWRKNGQLNWAWVASTAKTVYYTIQEKRNAKTAQSLKLNKDCVEIADAFSAYNKTGKEKQKCWAHLIRLAAKPRHYFRTKKEKEDYESFAE